MAKAIATVSGVALAPGVSRNGNLYTRDNIASAVRRAQQRIDEGRHPIGMYTHHDTMKTADLVGRVTKVWQAEDGSAKFTAAVADTPTGRNIASLLDTSDGEPFLRGVSIRGNWAGPVRRVKAEGGKFAETSSDLEFGRLDYTSDPGVTAAGVDDYAPAAIPDESGERYTISESAPEVRVETAISEETAPAVESAPPDGIREALRTALAAPVPVEESPPLSKRDSGLSGAGRVWADPGYQADKKQRYDLSTRQNAKSAWSYVSQKANAAKYTPAQLKRIKGRIKAALKKFGVTVAAEGWTVEPAFLVTEAVAEYMGDPSCAGSYSLSATNGPTTVTVCSYGLDPADLQVILQRACDAAGIALCALDPDMDGDIDVPGADAEDTDRDMGDDSGQVDNGDGVEDLVRRLMSAVRGESAEDPDALIAEARDTWARTAPAVTETAPTENPAPVLAAADREGTEDPAVSETTTQEAVGAAPAAALSQADIDAAVSRALGAADEARRARKAAKKAKAAESAPAAAVTETEDARIARLVEERLAAVRAESGPAAVTETEDQRIARLVEERLVAERQALTAQGAGPSRKGLVTEHSAARADGGLPADYPVKDGELVPMEKWSEGQRRAVGTVLQQTFLGSRAEVL